MYSKKEMLTMDKDIMEEAKRLYKAGDRKGALPLFQTLKDQGNEEATIYWARCECVGIYAPIERKEMIIKGLLPVYEKQGKWAGDAAAEIGIAYQHMAMGLQNQLLKLKSGLEIPRDKCDLPWVQERRKEAYQKLQKPQEELQNQLEKLQKQLEERAEDAELWYEKAVALGSQIGMCYLAQYLTTPKRLLDLENPRTKDKPFSSYDMFAKGLFFSGISDAEKIEKLWKRLYELHDGFDSTAAAALVELCNCQDRLEEAIAWARKGSELSSVNSMTFLAGCYEAGQGVQKDLHQAIALFIKAYQVGCQSAEQATSKLSKYLELNEVAQIADEIAYCYSQLGEKEEASHWWDIALKRLRESDEADGGNRQSNPLRVLSHWAQREQ